MIKFHRITFTNLQCIAVLIHCPLHNYIFRLKVKDRCCRRFGSTKREGEMCVPAYLFFHSLLLENNRAATAATVASWKSNHT